MINKVFTEQIGKNIEACVDDIVVKSEKAKDNMADSKKVFKVLRKFRVKLNPEKYVFAVAIGKS